MVYTRKTFWDQNLGRTTWAGSRQLWTAHYTLDAPWIPMDWTTWAVWQYTSHGDGHKYGAQSASIDMNRAKEGFVVSGPTLEERVGGLERRVAVLEAA